MAKKEIHNAIVTRNTDPDLGTQLRGAVFFNAPGLFDGEYPIPAQPTFQYASTNGAGFFHVPKVGDEIEVEVTVDDQNTPYDTTDVELPEPRWIAMVYSNAADMADEFKQNYPFRMGWKANSGHILLFDDFEGEERVEIDSSGGHSFIMDDKKGNAQVVVRSSTGALIQIDKEGSIKMIAKDGAYVFLNSKSNEVSIVSKDGAFLKLKEDAVISDKAGNLVGIKDGKFQVMSADELILNSGVINLEGGSVNIGKNAIFKALLAATVKAIFDGHLQATAVGLSSPPLPPNTMAIADLTPFTAVSADYVKLKGNIF